MSTHGNGAGLSPAKRALLDQWLREGRGAVDRVPRRDRGAPVPLSFAQERMLLAEASSPGVPFRNQAVLLRVRGALDLVAFERATGELMRRHDVLRTRFPRRADGSRSAVVDSASSFELVVSSLRELPPREAEQVVKRFHEHELSIPTDLDQRLAQITLFAVSDDEHLCHFKIDHLLFDGWSLGILLGELSVLYTDFANGRASSLPEPKLQYADYALWERRRMRGPLLERLTRYWTQLLEPEIPILELPTDRPRTTPQSFKVGKINFALSDTLAASVRALARAESASVFTVLMASFQALIMRHTGQTDIAIVSPVATRYQPELQGLIGALTNHVVFRGDLRGDPTFRDLIARMREVTAGANAHQDLPIQHVRHELASRAAPGWQAPFRLMLILQNYPAPVLRLGRLPLEVVAVDFGTAPYEISLLLIDDRRPGFAGTLKYNSCLFEEGTIRTYLERFQTLLDAAGRAPERRLSALCPPYNPGIERSR